MTKETPPHDRFNLLYSKAVMMIGRTLYFKDKLKDKEDSRSEYDGNTPPKSIKDLERQYPDSKFEPNLISSELDNGMHAPAIDIDLPCHLVPSSTPGHFHLYIDKELTWTQYHQLLSVLTDIGIVEQGFYDQTVRFRRSFLRLPHVKKGQPSA